MIEYLVVVGLESNQQGRSHQARSLPSTQPNTHHRGAAVQAGRQARVLLCGSSSNCSPLLQAPLHHLIFVSVGRLLPRPFTAPDTLSPQSVPLMAGLLSLLPPSRPVLN
ncbi:hypothetical protein Pmani_018048 [Petrolisthes manimaculis]|uniref:Uncharacterized protein n=1 Tax=Petrolisthes manimaculis TaxID=1843537 RepID=A0AAE1U733_9EUCA|nr:hypothetical protein Pmani_018048 [Petrolisthes manimaculis]